MDLNGFHELSLPFLRCPVHGQRISFWVTYPCFDVNRFPESLSQRLKGYARDPLHAQVEPEELKQITAAVVEYCPKGMFVGAGVRFGPYHVEEEFGRRGDFNEFSTYWLGASASAIARMLEKNVTLPPSQEVVSKAEHVNSRGFRELEIHQNVCAGRSMGLQALERCPVCGEFLDQECLAVPRDIILSKKSIPKTHDLFRWVEYDSVLFASERFVNAFHDLELTGLSFMEVEVE